MKTFVGPRLRQLRRENNETQAEMAKNLGVSPAYINLIEQNQRSLSIRILVGLLENYGVDWQDVIGDQEDPNLKELSLALKDPLFHNAALEQRELRAALDSTPTLVSHFLKLHRDYRNLVDNMMRLGSERMPDEVLRSSPETVIHDFFRNNSNYFHELEAAASELSDEIKASNEDILTWLKSRLLERHKIEVLTGQVDEMHETLRIYDPHNNYIKLSEAFDYINKIFQLAHMMSFVEYEDLLDDMVSKISDQRENVINRAKVELANYFAAAVLMPYEEFLHVAQETRYDIDRLAARFEVSFEHVCHRLTTLQREGSKGIAFFFLRVDKAGNVTKRFNSTSFKIAEFGGSCPVWNMHTAFRTPGLIVPQFVELPEGDRFLTLSRTTERPTFSRNTQDRRLVISLGCSIDDAKEIIYAEPHNSVKEIDFSPIGINCHLCPREGYSQRAHQPLLMELNLDPTRRGGSRYDSS